MSGGATAVQPRASVVGAARRLGVLILESSGRGTELLGLEDNIGTLKAIDTLFFQTLMEIHNRVSGDFGQDEEVVQKITDSYMGTCEKELQKSGSKSPNENKEDLNMQPEIETGQVQHDRSSAGTDTNDISAQELSCKPPQKPSVDLEDEDAICTRTRARYSLANFTLDELENFLQETDDEDDLQHVDDEEEYRKFLVAVLQDVDGDSKSQENETVEDEDEDNDADFEIELEEALESDVDEVTRDLTQKENNRAVRRPETRQNKRLKASVQNSKRHLGQAKRPLRPLLPILPNETIPSFSPHDGKTLATWNAPTSRSSVNKDNLINGFAPNQIGQLYCLIHEHVQLLIQVFSICICDSSRQHIASQVHGLISEMLHKRNEVLAWKKVPFPGICFDFPCVYSSMPDEVTNSSFQAQRTLESNGFCGGQITGSAQQTYQRVASQTTHDRGRDSVSVRQVVEGSSWAPFVSGPVLSMLDVAPLNLAGGFLDDVNTVVQDYRRRRLESTSDTPLEREPLFPLPSLHAFPGVNCEGMSGSISSVNTATLSPSQQPPKKSLAAALVESTKKQSVAMVLKDIAKLAQQFFPLFNPALFPHKPPPAAVVNRILFTDAEDE
ncbi:Myb_DNA-bind_6 domain-containing protein [Cucumis melo var. makuwa]|nr:Myb_DNA-bind_6 domain-containing protein [Cucumis melo var. makuwa]